MRVLTKQHNGQPVGKKTHTQPDADYLLTQPHSHTSHSATLRHFIQAQRINARRDILALRAFRPDEFGTDVLSPSRAHIRAANSIMDRLRRSLLHSLEHVDNVNDNQPSEESLTRMLQQKELLGYRMKRLENVWQFYLELFNQRQTPFAPLLLAADRIALDCYQVTYTGLGVARSIPTPPPYSYMETGHTPATFRRGVSLTRLSHQENPFPIISLPYHRLNNPWTLGAIHHEVAHNLQSDLGLWYIVPKRIFRTLCDNGIPPLHAAVWQRWHKETWADLAGLLLGGPGVVVSLLDVLARSPQSTSTFSSDGVHPTPILRARINFYMLRRMGFSQLANSLEWTWEKLYPDKGLGFIPAVFLKSFPKAVEHVVDLICYQPYKELGNHSLAEVVNFKPIYVSMIEEAAQRLAAGTDPGIIPERFLVGAARHALQNRLAKPAQIKHQFYRALGNR